MGHLHYVRGSSVSHSSSSYSDCSRDPLLIIMVELSECNIKLDHSLGCPDDAPNWRLVPGFPIYGVGQPTNDGFNKVDLTFIALKSVFCVSKDY